MGIRNGPKNLKIIGKCYKLGYYRVDDKKRSINLIGYTAVNTVVAQFINAKETLYFGPFFAILA